MIDANGGEELSGPQASDSCRLFCRDPWHARVFWRFAADSLVRSDWTGDSASQSMVRLQIGRGGMVGEMSTLAAESCGSYEFALADGVDWLAAELGVRVAGGWRAAAKSDRIAVVQADFSRPAGSIFWAARTHFVEHGRQNVGLDLSDTRRTDAGVKPAQVGTLRGGSSWGTSPGRGLYRRVP